MCLNINRCTWSFHRLPTHPAKFSSMAILILMLSLFSFERLKFVTAYWKCWCPRCKDVLGFVWFSLSLSHSWFQRWQSSSCMINSSVFTLCIWAWRRPRITLIIQPFRPCHLNLPITSRPVPPPHPLSWSCALLPSPLQQQPSDSHRLRRVVVEKVARGSALSLLASLACTRRSKRLWDLGLSHSTAWAMDDIEVMWHMQRNFLKAFRVCFAGIGHCRSSNDSAAYSVIKIMTSIFLWAWCVYREFDLDALVLPYRVL